MSRPRKLVIVLHTHLPWVLHHGAWPHGEDWLFEATTHCYLPLLAMLQRKAQEGAKHLLTITVSPVLAAQWRHPAFPAKLQGYLQQRLQAAEQARDLPLARFWFELFHERQRFFAAIGEDIAGAFARLAENQVIELGSCAATHAYLPLVHDLRSARLSLQLAQAYHRRVFGRRAQGVWLPECAYRPAGPFRHPVTRAFESFRPGLETLVEEAGFAWTVLDSHLLLGGRPVPASAPGVFSEPVRSHPSLYQPARIGTSSVTAFFRDPHTSLQVWSREHGYPGEERYLDFHKRHWPSGLKLWRVTHPKADLAHKAPYDPEATAAAVDSHAHHFLEVVAPLPEAAEGVVVAPFDTELFGHWWFEGVAFLEQVLTKAASHPEVRTTVASLALSPRAPAVALPEGSWGEGGDHRVWVNPETERFWWELEKLERAAWEALGQRPGHDGFRSAQAQELLLALASDWPFLVTTQAARDYAQRRFALHVARARELFEQKHAKLPAWTAEDAVFPDGLLLSVLDGVLAGLGAAEVV
jgi:1,4-alpha-glucan branching enzyme